VAQVRVGRVKLESNGRCGCEWDSWRREEEGVIVGLVWMLVKLMEDHVIVCKSAISWQRVVWQFLQ